MLTTVAVLIIVLGLMVSLARYVRNSSATQLTRELLVDLDTAMSNYCTRNHLRAAPVVPLAAADQSLPDEEALLRSAEANNVDYVRLLKQAGALGGEEFGKLPISVFDSATFRDAWGTPIIYMPGRHPAIGMAPDDSGFFFSAGPDRQYRSRQDNLYSYEQGRVR